MSATEINRPAHTDNIGLLKSQDNIQCNASLSSFSSAATVCKKKEVSRSKLSLHTAFRCMPLGAYSSGALLCHLYADM